MKKVVTDGDDLLATLLFALGDEETRANRGKEEQERYMFTINTLMSNIKLLGKRKADHDASSSSSSSCCSAVESKRRRVVSEEPIRAETTRKVKLNRRDASSSSLTSDEPIRKSKPVRGINQVRQPVSEERKVTPGWVVDLMREKKGVDGKLIIEKEITKSDLSRNLTRLLMPFKQMEDMDFLSEQELNIIERHYRKESDQGADVFLVGPRGGKPWELNLRKWDMKTTTNYALCSGWHDVCLSYNIKKGEIIRIWSFHSQDKKLYFALVLDTVPDPAQAIAHQAPAPPLAIASSSSMAPVVTHYPFICQETNKRLCNFPKRKRTPRVCVPAPSTNSGNLGRQSILDGLDLNRPMPQVCTEMAPLEAVQETDTRTSLVLLTATSQASDTETTALDHDRVEDKET